MIWAEVETLKQYIDDQNIGTDTYIATVPRGLLQRIVSDGGSVEINGSGWLLSAWSNGDPYSESYIAPLHINIDHDKTIELTAGKGKSAKITFDSGALGTTIDLSFTEISLNNEELVTNVPIRFNEYLKVETAKSNYANSGVYYIIDSRGGYSVAWSRTSGRKICRDVSGRRCAA